MKPFSTRIENILLLSLLVAATVFFAYAMLQPPETSPPTVRKLNPIGTLWYIQINGGFDSPTQYLNRTCPTVRKIVTNVVLANNNAQEATVTCK